ncbi:MAG TPA: SDR family NAD(P)-dependent oxidoreductase, partial [Croceibacterium sp.]|nr:SDR family NAD(P)-dependent oxidoreductase [Croceibacterium sp.]
MSILQGRVVVVTGASSGIGQACALAFARKGAKVVLAARRVDRLTQLVADIEAAGGEALAVGTDVTDEAAVQALFDRTVERFGTVDVLINNAGVADSTAIYDMPLELWEKV